MASDGMTYIFLQQAVEFLFAVIHAHAVTGVDDPDEGVRGLEVVAPVRSESSLSADVP